jgi:hypothetical protein
LGVRQAGGVPAPACWSGDSLHDSPPDRDDLQISASCWSRGLRAAGAASSAPEDRRQAARDGPRRASQGMPSAYAPRSSAVPEGCAGSETSRRTWVVTVPRSC